MKFTTKTEYGLVCLIHMAKQGVDRMVTIKKIVHQERFSHTYIEKILQQLKAADIVVSHQGKEGGYTLARSPSQITMREIIEALEGDTFHIYCKPSRRKGIVCTHFSSLCALKPIWGRTKNLLDDFFNGITLEAIAKEV